MLSDFLQDSRVYQDVFTKGKDEGFAEGIETGKMQALSQTRLTLGQGLLELVRMRFPVLETLARARVNKIDTADTLSQIIVGVGMAKTEQEARRVLESNLL